MGLGTGGAYGGGLCNGGSPLDMEGWGCMCGDLVLREEGTVPHG